MRIAIVNDVPLAVEAIRRVVTDAGDHRLAWVAVDGAEAVERCTFDTPDLILMDLIMPRLDGIEATRRIMARNPCPIVVVTADVEDNSSRVFDAMGAGALDAVNTPVLQFPGSCKGAEALLDKIETIRRLIGAPGAGKAPVRSDRARPVAARHLSPLVAIGASAGGPAAVGMILAHLPVDFPAPIIIVQHVDAQFAQGLANWLDYQTPLKVRLAQECDSPQAGVVLLAGRDQHLVLTTDSPNTSAFDTLSSALSSSLSKPGDVFDKAKDKVRNKVQDKVVVGTASANSIRLTYTRQPAESAYCPSIDVFFASVEQLWSGDAIGVLLTGMGRDGAEGLRRLHSRGHHTIVQDRPSSAVYGMPKAAADLQAATEILPLNQIAARLLELTARKVAART